MRKNFFFFCASFVFGFCLINFNVYAQKHDPSVIDSLQKKFKNYIPACKSPCLGDSIKVNLLLDLAWQFNYNKTDTVLSICNAALNLSQKINYLAGVARSYHVIGNFYNAQGDYPNVFKYLSTELTVLDKLLVSGKNIKLVLGKKAACFNTMGNAYYNEGKYVQAINSLSQALTLNKELNNEEEVAINYNSMGRIYRTWGKVPEALDCYFKTLAYAEKYGKDNIAAPALGSIGRIYRLQNDLAKALGYYLKALAINIKSKDNIGVGINYMNIGVLYSKKMDNAKAMECYQKSLEAFLIVKYKAGIASDYANIGALYYDQAGLLEKEGQQISADSNYLKALDLYNKAYKIQGELGRNTEMATYLANIGLAYSSLRKKSEAEKYLLQSLALSDSLGDFEGSKMANEELSEFYNKTGNHIKALDHYKKATAAKDSLFNESKTEEFTRLEMNYEFDKKEAISKAVYEKQTALAEAEKKTALAEAEKKRLLAEAEKKLQVSDADKKRLEAETKTQKLSQVMTQQEMRLKLANAETQLQKQKVLRYSMIGGAVILLLSLVFGFLLYKRRTEQKQKETSLSLQVSETEMKALRSQMNPHFIFNALQSIQTFLLSHKSEEANEYLLKFAKLMRLVLENSQHSEVPLKEDMQALELYMQLESIRLQHPFTYQFHIDKSVDVENDNIPPLILQPFVENAIWHGLQCKLGPGHIDIYIGKKSNALYATVEDNGVGRDMSKQVAQPMLIKKESLGMKLTEDRLKILNELKKVKAQFKITDLITKDDKPAGTKVELSLPLS